MYENLATKYRPKTFDEVIGQDSVVKTLTNALKLSRIAHAYLFFGPRGCGKTTVARILAKSLNCHHPKDVIPCNRCVSCIEISQSRSLDVLEIDAASNTQVDKVREVIIENVNLVPSRDKYKIYILDEVHMLSTSSFNALLKTIEEPPGHVVFIMATTEFSKVPATIVSRCQDFRFKLICEELIIEKLKHIITKEKIKAQPDAIKLIARVSGGAMREAITILDRAVSFSNGNIDINSLKELLGFAKEDLIKEIANAILEHNLKSLHTSFKKIAYEGYDVLLMLKDLRDIFAETFLYLQGFSQSDNILKHTKETNPFIFAKLARRLNKIIEEVKSSDLQLVSAEMALFTLMESTIDIEGIIRKIEALEQRLQETSKIQGFMPSMSGGDIGITPQDTHSKSTGILPKIGGGVKDNSENYRTEAFMDRPSDDIEHFKNLSDSLTPENGTIAPMSIKKRTDEMNSFLWKKILDAIGHRSPLLYNIIVSSKVTFVNDSTWKFVFSNKFHAQTVAKHKKDIESVIEKFSGSRIAIDLEYNYPQTENSITTGYRENDHEIGTDGAREQVKETINNSGEETENSDTENLQWMDLNSENSDISDPEIEKLTKIFRGKIKKINKL